MVQKYRFGEPIQTDSVVEELPISSGLPQYGTWEAGDTFSFRCRLKDTDMVFGLGEANRGINKRGYIYESNCRDDDEHFEHKRSLYAAHNFLMVAGEDGEVKGFYFDTPAVITFDIGYTRQNEMTVTSPWPNLDVYVIWGESCISVVKQFRKIIGRSYIPPKFAFGYGQSRWGYVNENDIRRVVAEHRNAGVPLDMVYMDIDYMQDYKDFTINEERFPDFPAFVREMQAEHIHLVPIIDAGVKVEKGYPVYEEGVEKGYFCKRADGSDFEAVVWPGVTHFPDVLNPEARKWFGDWYRVLLDAGIDGFWNDMNEPAIFYTPEGAERLRGRVESIFDGEEGISVDNLPWICREIKNNPEDYASFYHNIDGKQVRHDLVHNLYGYNMTRAAAEAFERLVPDKKILMFSRSSYIGMHRYGGVWTGDNKAWWSHLLLNIKMLPSLNMCGFLYSGADLGGFGENTTRDLLLRWLALGVFTPLMRNHSALGTREQEFYQFEQTDDFKDVISIRYRLLPYLYSTYLKAAYEDDMIFKPLCFVYTEDSVAKNIEDQLLVGEELMIAPVYQQNAEGRIVYLPEEMMLVRLSGEQPVETEILAAGLHFVKVALNEVVFFIRKGYTIPVAPVAEYTDAVDYDNLVMVGYKDRYEFFEEV